MPHHTAHTDPTHPARTGRSSTPAPPSQAPAHGPRAQANRRTHEPRSVSFRFLDDRQRPQIDDPQHRLTRVPDPTHTVQQIPVRVGVVDVPPGDRIPSLGDVLPPTSPTLRTPLRDRVRTGTVHHIVWTPRMPV